MKKLSEVFPVEDLVNRFRRLGLRPGMHGWVSSTDTNVCCPLAAVCKEHNAGVIDEDLTFLMDEFGLIGEAYWGFIDGYDDCERMFPVHNPSAGVYNDGYDTGVAVRQQLQILYGPLPSLSEPVTT